MANSTLSRFVISRQIPVPDHEFDLRPQRKPNLTIDSRPFSVLREPFVGSVSMLVVGSGDPCTTFLCPWSSRPSTMELATVAPLDSWLLTRSTPAGLRKASSPRPIRPESRFEAQGRLTTAIGRTCSHFLTVLRVFRHLLFPSSRPASLTVFSIKFN